jgi:biopolymer transport protein ExbD
MIRRTKFDQINVIPLVDVVLVLLVIVLSSATFLQSRIDVDLPQSSAKSKAIQKESIEIVITEDNKYFLNNEPLDFQSLQDRIKSCNKDQAFQVRGDRHSELKSFVQLVDLFKTLNIKNVAIVTQQ